MNFKSFDEVDRLTIPEYELLMHSVKLKEVDRDYRNHLQAFLNYAVRAERKTGKYKSKPVYGKFKKFYNYEAEIKKASESGGSKSKFPGIGQFFKKGV